MSHASRDSSMKLFDQQTIATTMNDTDFIFQRQIRDFSSKTDPSRFTHLAIFDFDSTLFRSPLPNADLWTADLKGCVISDCAWFLEPRTLSFPYVPMRPDDSWWDARVVGRVKELRVEEAYQSSIVIVLTGRRRDLFYDRIAGLCQQLGDSHSLPDLFHLIFLKEHENSDGSKTYQTTVDFKLSVLENLLGTFPNLRTIEVWDDRQKHLDIFGKQFQELVKLKRIDSFTSEYVLQDPLLSKLIAEDLEHDLVMELIGKCNARILAAEERELVSAMTQKLSLDKAPLSPVVASPLENTAFTFPTSRSPLDSILPGITPTATAPPSVLAESPTSTTPASPKQRTPKSQRRGKQGHTPRKSISCFRTIIDVVEVVSYTGIFLGEESRTALLAAVPIPPGNRHAVKAHHITICLGAASEELVSPLGGLGARIQLEATDSGATASGGVVAVRVRLREPQENLKLSNNAIPHCTLYVAIGCKARESNDISVWSPLSHPIPLEGVITEKRVYGKRGASKGVQKPAADVSLGNLVKKYHPQLKGREVGEAVKRVEEWMEKTHMDNASHNAPDIEFFVSHTFFGPSSPE